METNKNNNWKYLTLKDGEKVIVDSEDYERLRQKIWVLRKTEGRKPQVINIIWKDEQGKIITTYLAREVMQEHQNIVIRKNTRELDFRKSNLLIATRKEKERMRGKTEIETTSKYKGVSLDKKTGKWRASICVDDKRKYLGLYLTESEAARVYNEAARKYFGEFAFENRFE